MSYRVQCSACGKVMALEDDAAGERLVCIACGTMLTAPPPPIVQAVETIQRPGALGVRTWRIHARKAPDALPTVLDWVSQPSGRVDAGSLRADAHDEGAITLEAYVARGE